MPSFLSVAATGLAGLLGPILGTQPVAPPQPLQPVAALVSSPAAGVRGTMILVHGGGWQGPGPISQKALMERPGEMLVQHGWKVVSVDYSAGAAGLQDVLDAAGAELGQPTGSLLCLYGESAGAQLALVAASKLPSVDCVVAAGAPTDLQAYQAEATASGDRERGAVSAQIRAVFGSTPTATAPYEPVHVAGSIAADVLMLREADDRIMPREQLDRFLAASATTQSVELESDPNADPGAWWLHGTLSPAGRAGYLAAIGSFVDRAAESHRAEKAAARTGCAGARRAVAGDPSRLTSILRCLARKDARVARSRAARAGSVSVRLRGRVNAARAWTALRSTDSGRRMLAAAASGRATSSVHSGDPTRITIRVKASRG